MEVVNENVAHLSNYEVLQLMLEIKKDEHSKKNVCKPLATISYQTIKYLEKTPCALQSSQVIEDFCKAVQPFKLTRAEKLMMLNLRPMTAVEIQLVIQDSEERLSEDQVEQLLKIVAEKIPAVSSSD